MDSLNGNLSYFICDLNKLYIVLYKMAEYTGVSEYLRQQIHSISHPGISHDELEEGYKTWCKQYDEVWIHNFGLYFVYRKKPKHKWFFSFIGNGCENFFIYFFHGWNPWESPFWLCKKVVGQTKTLNKYRRRIVNLFIYIVSRFW